MSTTPADTLSGALLSALGWFGFFFFLIVLLGGWTWAAGECLLRRWSRARAARRDHDLEEFAEWVARFIAAHDREDSTYTSAEVVRFYHLRHHPDVTLIQEGERV